MLRAVSIFLAVIYSVTVIFILKAQAEWYSIREEKRGNDHESTVSQRLPA